MSFSKELDILLSEAKYDSEAIIELSELYLRHGRRGVPSDYQEVIRFAEKRVEKQTSYTCTVFLRTFKLGDPDPVVRQAAFDYLLPIATNSLLVFYPTLIEFVALTYVGSHVVSTAPDPSKDL